MMDESAIGQGPLVDRERRLLAVLDRALAAPAESRHERVFAECAGDRAMADEALALLGQEEALGHYLESPWLPGARSESAAPSPPDEESSPPVASPPQRIGPFEVLRSLGAGGMGQVLLARQTEPVERLVALKLMRPSVRGREARSRFQAERQALARLSHRNVARLYESGATADGHLYFAMEVVAGPPITTYCDEHRLTTDERLRLFVQVCRGVHHAHQKQLVHRDLKPANILVLENEDGAVPKVIDFGIAKALDRPLHEETMLTGAWLPGAPAYTSPEALARQPGDVDTRTDVYALGVLLYDLLTGCRPFEEEGLEILQVLQRVRDEEPRRPSSRLRALAPERAESLAAARRTDVAAWMHHLRGDLDCIVLKAMSKERERRYDSAAALAADVERHLANEVVEAQPPSNGYRFRKLLRRHRLAAALTAALGLALLLGLGGTLLALGRARAAERQAWMAARRADEATTLETKSRAEAEAVTNFLSDLMRGADPWQRGDPATTSGDLVRLAAQRLQTELAGEPAVRARLLATVGHILLDLGLDADAESAFRSALALRENAFGAWDLQVAESLDDLGGWSVEQGQPQDAVPLHRRSLAIAELHGSSGDRQRARSLLHLGRALVAIGQPDEAAAIFRTALATEDRLPAPRALERAQALTGLASAELSRGRAGEAVDLLSEAVEIQQSAESESSPDVVRTLAQLARARLAQGDARAALPAVERALRLQRRALGPSHWQAHPLEVTLGDVLVALGRFDEARAACNQALSGRQGQPASRDKGRLVGEAFACLARAEHGLGDLAGAEKDLRLSLAAAENGDQGAPSWTAEPLFQLAQLLAEEGRRDEATQAFQRCLEVLSRDSGKRSAEALRVQRIYRQFLSAKPLTKVPSSPSAANATTAPPRERSLPSPG